MHAVQKFYVFNIQVFQFRLQFKDVQKRHCYEANDREQANHEKKLDEKSVASELTFVNNNDWAEGPAQLAYSS